MPIVSFTYTIIDGKTPPQKSYFTLYCEGSSKTIPNLEEVANDAASVVAQLLKGGLIACRISFETELGAIVANPDLAIPEADSDVEEGATFVFRPLDGDIRPAVMRIATFNENLVLEGTRIVDITEPSVDTFIQMITGGLLAYPFDFEFSNSRGEPLTIFQGAQENFKRRKNKRKKP